MIRNSLTDSFIIGVTNVVNSLLSTLSDCGVYLNAGKEYGVASTKSFTSQVIVLFLICLHLTRPLLESDYCNKILCFISRSSLDLLEHLDTEMRELSERIFILCKNKSSIFILGSGYNRIIAYESALKIKELSYFHAEGYSLGSLKHGPFALIERGTPVILLTSGVMDNKIKICYEELKSREAEPFIIGENNDVSLYPLCDLWNVISMQYLSYYLCILRGNDPDFPRNLAKVVSVD